MRAGRRAGWAGLLVAGLVGISAAHGYFATVNKTDHTEVHIVPTPGKVTVDGDLGDWDMSGAILMYLDEASKETISVRAAMMYDAEALYVGAHVKDPTPMVNNYALGGEVNMSWNADAVQLRLISDPSIQSSASLQTGGRMSAEEQKYVCHMTLWYSTLEKKAGLYVCYTLNFQDGQVNPPGVAGAYKEDADGKGYVLEYRLPWNVLRAPRPLKGGDRIQLQCQLHWGQDSGTGLKYGMTDVRNPQSGDLGYMGPSSWGAGVFEKTGNIKLQEKTIVGRAQGHIPVKFVMDKDGKASLAIYDAKGTRTVRTSFGGEPYKAGEQTYMWDGLDDKDRPAAAGAYVFKVLTHGGLQQTYIVDVGVSGNPPYQTGDKKGGWAGDDGSPLYVSADGDRMVLGTGAGEAADITICCDLEGNKLWGINMGGYTNGPATAYKGFGYFYKAGHGILGKFELDRGYLSPFTGGKPEVSIMTRGAGEDDKAWGSRSWQVMALVGTGDLVLASSFGDNKILLIDLASGAVKGDVPCERPSGMAIDPAGTLYVISGSALGRYDLGAKRFTPIVADLDSPGHLACDKDGNVYVSLGGKTMQVWRVSKDGKVLQKYGKPGGRPALGKFDPAGMLSPGAITVDKNGRLWVAERDNQPKRYSVWSPDGALYKQFFGSINYSSRAYVDPEEPQYVYVQSVRYLVDYDKGTWQVDATILRPWEEGGVKFSPPERHSGASFVNYKGRKFLWVREGSPTPGLYEWTADRFVPRMAMNPPSPEAPNGAWWLDDNNDGHVQDQEVRKGRPAPGIWLGHPMDSRLNIYWHQGVQWHGQGGEHTEQPYKIVRWDFRGFNDKGGLTYADPAKPTVVGEDPDGGAVSCYYPDEDGSVFVLVSGGSLPRGVRPQGTGHRVVKFSPAGEKLWEYHNVHCAFAWTSDSYTPGYLVGVCSFPEGSTKELVALTGYYGQYFLLDKQDGLFFDAVGKDQRSPYEMGANIVLTENFNGAMFKNVKNGKTYFLGGDADCRAWELGGIDTIKRQSGRLTVTPAMFAQSDANARQNLMAQQMAQGGKATKVVRLKGAAADGKYDEWVMAPPMQIVIEQDRQAMAQLGYDDQNLYVRFQVSDPTPLTNKPTDYKLLFKTGDSVEIQLGADMSKRRSQAQNVQQMAVGDLRLIMTRSPEGKMLATLYRPKTAAAEKPNKHVFESVVWKETFDEVVAVNDIPMHCATDKQGYVVEAAVPWALLGIKPQGGLVLVGDVGVIYGDEGGTRNAIRYMWSDKSPEVSINNDIPSEVRIHPNQWGRLVLE